MPRLSDALDKAEPAHNAMIVDLEPLYELYEAAKAEGYALSALEFRRQVDLVASALLGMEWQLKRLRRVAQLSREVV